MSDLRSASDREFRLDEKRILVTGGSRGLGAAICEAISNAGALVVSVARGLEAAEHDVAGQSRPTVCSLQADISQIDPKHLLDLAESTVGGPLYGVVHAAGIQHRESATDFGSGDWQRILEVNLNSGFFISQELARRQLAAKRPGSHVFVGSITSFRALPRMPAYAVSKAGVLALVRSLGSEWASSGIRVNGLGPGYFRTQMTEGLRSNVADRSRLLNHIPMARFGEPIELGPPAVFLLSDASRYITGHMLMVDGGWCAN